MQFSQTLRKLMDDRGLSNYQLAKDLDVHPTTIANWLEGKTPRKKTILQVANYFDVTTDYLLNGTKKAPAKDSERELPHAEYREVLQESGIRILLDADAKVSQDDLDDILEFIKFKQRKNER